MPTEKQPLPGGYMDGILTINLTEQSYVRSDLDRRTCDLFFGGRGLGVALLFEHFLSLEQAGKYKNAFEEVIQRISESFTRLTLVNWAVTVPFVKA